MDPDFARRAKEQGGGFVIGGQNYGQGSSREHAALAPMYLGVKAVIAKSFARIHRANLINFGILPLVFCDPEDYNRLQQGDELYIAHVGISLVDNIVIIENRTGKYSFEVKADLTPRQIAIIKAGGLLNYTKEHVK